MVMMMIMAYNGKKVDPLCPMEPPRQYRQPEIMKVEEIVLEMSVHSKVKSGEVGKPLLRI